MVSFDCPFPHGLTGAMNTAQVAAEVVANHAVGREGAGRSFLRLVQAQRGLLQQLAGGGRSEGLRDRAADERDER